MALVFYTKRMTNTIHLQAIGNVPAIPINDVQAGDTLVWDFGLTSEVISVIPVTRTMVELTARAADGQQRTRRKRGTTLVARATR